jgi:6-phosphogluconolactonase
MKVKVFDGVDELARYCAGTLRGTLALSAPERASIALSGGSTPQWIYEAIAESSVPGVPWNCAEVFFVDERAVGADHEDSNYRLARAHLFDSVPVPRSQIHRMPADSSELVAAAAQYEQLIRGRVPAGPNGVPVLDLVWLGMGKDGHTASLFPGTAALEEKERLVCVNFVPELESWRMTLTYPLLRQARHVQIVVTGSDKAERLRSVLEGGSSDSELAPVSRLQLLDGSLEWVLDREAASLLDSSVEP